MPDHRRHEHLHLSGARSSSRRNMKRWGLVATLLIVVLIIAIAAVVSRFSPPEPVAEGPAASTRVKPTLAQVAKGEHWFVEPTGSKSADGSKGHPIDLATALSKDSPAAPGDTVWVRAGTYTGNFVSDLKGAEQAPILVRGYPGEHVVLSAASANAPALAVNGPSVWFADFEIMNAHPERFTPGVAAPFTEGAGVAALGSHLKFINLLVHDLEAGFWVPATADDVEIYGNIIYHNGWQRADNSGEGHGINTPSKAESRFIRDNIIFNQFGHGIYSFGSSDNLTIEGNTLFNNGGIARFLDRNILVSGPAKDLMLRANMTYYTGEASANIEGVNLGYGRDCTGARVIDNYFTGGNPLNLTNCQPTAMRGNTLIGRADASAKSLYGKSNELPQTPAGAKVFVRPNQFEPGRAHITVFNWDRLPEVTADLAGVPLKKGDRYELRYAMDFYGPAVESGTFDGSPLKISLVGLTSAQPIGKVPNAPPKLGRTLAVFVLVDPAKTAPGAPASPAPSR
jgi:parallel beta-helix repeat protein